ncbi:MAG: hypothetical protein ACYDAO_07440 [Thermoplasmataceae archaeon]
MESKLFLVQAWLKNNQKVSMPVLAIGVSLLLVFLSLILRIAFIPYMIPLAVFSAMHYTGFYGVKKRLLYGLAIFFVIWILAVTMMYPYSFTNPGAQTLNTSNGGTVTTSITPFYGTHKDFKVSSVFTSVPDNQSFMPSFGIISDTFSGASLYKYCNLSTVTSSSSGVVEINLTLTSLPNGVYYIQTNLIGKTFNITSNVVKGPLDISGTTFYSYLLIDYLPLYVLFFEVILSGGMMVARSIGHSRSYYNKNLNQ